MDDEFKELSLECINRQNREMTDLMGLRIGRMKIGFFVTSPKADISQDGMSQNEQSQRLTLDHKM